MTNLGSPMFGLEAFPTEILFKPTPREMWFLLPRRPLARTGRAFLETDRCLDLAETEIVGGPGEQAEIRVDPPVRL